MDAQEIEAHPTVEQFNGLAEDFVSACASGDSEALQRIKERFQLGRVPALDELRKHVQQRLRKLSGSEIGSDALSLSDARLLVADAYAFKNWERLLEFIEAIDREHSPVARFEAAVDAVITGDVKTLESLLREKPELIRARSMREHGATLLHYVAANGVEDYRQKTPKNVIEVAKILLKAGAEVDADLTQKHIGSTTLGLVATSIHPAHAGVQIELMETLLEAGAALDGVRGGWSFVNGCLANGRPEAAQFLARRGALLDLEGAAGVGRLDLVQAFFDEDGSLKPIASKEQMESGFMWACEYGHTRVAEFLLDKGLDIATNRGMTGLHWAMVGGHLDTIKLLLERKAPLEAENNFGGTVLGCAIWAVGNSDAVYRWPDSDTDWLTIVRMLIDAGAIVYESDCDFPTGNEPVDELLRQHGMKG